jgi:hypothetical protein
MRRRSRRSETRHVGRVTVGVERTGGLVSPTLARAFAIFAAPVPLAWACAGAGCQPAPMATVLELPKTPRQPDGVVIDPEPALPPAFARAPAEGVVSLKEPLDEGIVGAAIEAFFSVFTSHAPEALEGVLSRSARLLDSHGGSSYAIVRDELLRRVAAFKAANVTTVPIHRVERAEYADLGENGLRPRPGEMRPGDILVRVHLAAPHAGADRLLGDVVVLLFRSETEAAEGPPRLRVVGFDEQDEP